MANYKITVTTFSGKNYFIIYNNMDMTTEEMNESFFNHIKNPDVIWIEAISTKEQIMTIMTSRIEGVNVELAEDSTPYEPIVH